MMIVTAALKENCLMMLKSNSLMFSIDSENECRLVVVVVGGGDDDDDDENFHLASFVDDCCDSQWLLVEDLAFVKDH